MLSLPSLHIARMAAMVKLHYGVKTVTNGSYGPASPVVASHTAEGSNLAVAVPQHVARSPSPTLTQAAAGRAVRSCSGSCGPVQTVGCDERRTAAFAEAAAQTSRSESLEEMAALRTKLPFAAPAP